MVLSTASALKFPTEGAQECGKMKTHFGIVGVGGWRRLIDGRDKKLDKREAGHGMLDLK